MMSDMTQVRARKNGAASLQSTAYVIKTETLVPEKTVEFSKPLDHFLGISLSLWALI